MNRRAFLASAACTVATGSAAVAQAPAPPQGPFAEAARYSADRDGVGFLVVRNGIVLTEDYANGGGADARWPLGAGTRVFATLLAAALIESGMMRLDEPAANTLVEWEAHPVKAMISIRGLLNGTCGLMFGDRIGGAVEAVALEPSAPPGERYTDDPARFVILAEIARRKLDRRGRTPDPARYLTENTLIPIGCAPIDWTRGPDGAAFFHDGAAVSTRAWAQVGELVRRQGVWRAQQLVSDNTLREALVGTYAAPRAGMSFWLAAGLRGSDDIIDSDLWRANPAPPGDLAMAAGSGGQRLYVIPSWNVVIARQARGLEPRGWSDAAFLNLIRRDLGR